MTVFDWLMVALYLTVGAGDFNFCHLVLDAQSVLVLNGLSQFPFTLVAPMPEQLAGTTISMRDSRAHL